MQAADIRKPIVERQTINDDLFIQSMKMRYDFD